MALNIYKHMKLKKQKKGLGQATHMSDIEREIVLRLVTANQAIREAGETFIRLMQDRYGTDVESVHVDGTIKRKNGDKKAGSPVGSAGEKK